MLYFVFLNFDNLCIDICGFENKYLALSRVLWTTQLNVILQVL